MKKPGMAHTFKTDYAFNIEEESWQPWHNWLSHHGRRIMDHALEKALADTSEHIDNACFEINVLLIGDPQIRDINRAFRGKDTATNVLSFPQFDTPEELENALAQDCADENGEDQTLLLGDIVLSYETIEQQAEAAPVTMHDHLAHMLVHGLLHLLSYDHQFDREAQEMESLECDILNAFGIKSPYTISRSMAY